MKAAAEAITAHLGYDVRRAGLGAARHDLGKAHPHFQAKIYGEEVPLHEQFPHRHELSSLGFLPLFDRADWPALVDMVVAHHKSIRQDARERGILDLQRLSGPWANHLLNWYALLRGLAFADLPHPAQPPAKLSNWLCC